MLNLDDFQSLKRKVEKRRQFADRAQGAYDQLLETIRDRFGCYGLDKAEEKLTELAEAEQRAAEKYAKAREEFDQKWGDYLNE